MGLLSSVLTDIFILLSPSVCELSGVALGVAAGRGLTIAFGDEDGELIISLDKEVGRVQAFDTIKKAFNLGRNYLSGRGITISLEDLNVEQDVVNEANVIIEKAEKKTGVRPAFVLAVLKQETNLGANVGSCVITNLSTGETKNTKSGQVFSKGIHPTRDLPLLQEIVKELGRNPLSTIVSCPQSVGFGGAMGPAQFIPSTWNLIKSKVKNALDKSIPDPWNPADAIMASSILLQDNGASARTYTAERNAACKYYSGRICSDPTVKNAFYGNAVMALAEKIQADIDLLSN